MVLYCFVNLRCNLKLTTISVQILTTEDLQNFKSELFAELKSILKTHSLPVKKWLKSGEVKKILKVSPGKAFANVFTLYVRYENQ